MKGIRIFFALIMILFTFNFIEADNFRYSRTKKSRYIRKLPEGLSQVAVIYQKNLHYPGLGGTTFTLTPENLLKWKELLPGIFPKLEEILKSNGFKYNIKNLKTIIDNIYKIIRKAWEDAKSDLKNCKEFEKIHKGRAYKQFIEEIENRGIPFNFNNGLSESEAYAWNETSQSGDNNFINFPYEQFYHITEYILKKMKQNQDQIDIGDYRSDLNILYSYLGHEMMHAFTGVFHYDSNDTSEQGINRKERVECEVHCLQKQCLDPNVRMPDYCEKRCGKNYCVNEFRECKKKPPPDEDEDSSGDESSRTPNRGDHGDDNFSSSSGNYLLNSLLASLGSFPINPDQDFFSYTYYPDILI
jgi:hypothetical protein